jgi:hypothetical protein
MIFGAFSGMEAVAPDWVNNLTNIRTIESLLDQLVPAE